jgi:hypothetical protein
MVGRRRQSSQEVTARELRRLAIALVAVHAVAGNDIPRPAGRQHRPASGSPPQMADTGRPTPDRVLNEAFETADPLNLMRLFGVTEQTAMRCVAAAHPERTAELPQ